MAMQFRLESEQRAGRYDGKIWACISCVHVSNLDLYFSVHGSFRNLVSNFTDHSFKCQYSSGD